MNFNYLALLIATPVAFVLGAIWNSPPVFGNLRSELLSGDVAIKAKQRPSPGVVAGELLRCLLLAATVGVFMAWLKIDDVPGALQFALLYWFGFQAVLLSGGILWEGMPPKLYLIHVGDALQKAIVLAVIFAVV